MRSRDPSRRPPPLRHHCHRDTGAGPALDRDQARQKGWTIPNLRFALTTQLAERYCIRPTGGMGCWSLPTTATPSSGGSAAPASGSCSVRPLKSCRPRRCAIVQFHRVDRGGRPRSRRIPRSPPGRKGQERAGVVCDEEGRSRTEGAQGRREACGEKADGQLASQVPVDGFRQKPPGNNAPNFGHRCFIVWHFKADMSLRTHQSD